MEHVAGESGAEARGDRATSGPPFALAITKADPQVLHTAEAGQRLHRCHAAGTSRIVVRMHRSPIASASRSRTSLQHASIRLASPAMLGAMSLIKVSSQPCASG